MEWGKYCTSKEFSTQPHHFSNGPPLKKTVNVNGINVGEVEPLKSNKGADLRYVDDFSYLGSRIQPQNTRP